MDFINGVILPAFSTILLALLGIAVKHLIGWLKSKGVLAKLEANKSVVSIVVNAIEQIYTEARGEDKLKIAEGKVAKILTDKGIKITQEELRILIESCIREINNAVKSGVK